MKITAQIKPVPLARPKLNTRTLSCYFPKNNVNFKNDLQKIAILARHRQGEKKIDSGQIKLTVHFYKKSNSLTGRKYGDLDNHVKAILDALNGICFKDDSQITELHAYKHSGEDKVEIEIEVI